MLFRVVVRVRFGFRRFSALCVECRKDDSLAQVSRSSLVGVRCQRMGYRLLYAFLQHVKNVLGESVVCRHSVVLVDVQLIHVCKRGLLEGQKRWKFSESEAVRKRMCVLLTRTVGQYHIYTVYMRYLWQENRQVYGHIRSIYTVLANPSCM
jgi:hypothetical protein